MTTINQLTTVDEVAAGDLLPIFSQAQGGTRSASLTVIAALLQTLVSTAGTLETQYSAPAATGFSVTINPTTDGGSVHLLLTPVAGYAAGTIVLPAVAECEDGQEVVVNSTQAITTLTVSGNGATAVNGAPTTMAANAFFRLRFDGIFQSWYRIG